MKEIMKHSEVGISHPYLPSAVRILNDGRIAITTGDEGQAGIILDPATGVITMYASKLELVFDEILIDGKPMSKEKVISYDRAEWKDLMSSGKMRQKIMETENDRS